jgi:hypothetical protein
MFNDREDDIPDLADLSEDLIADLEVVNNVINNLRATLEEIELALICAYVERREIFWIANRKKNALTADTENNNV